MIPLQDICQQINDYIQEAETDGIYIMIIHYIGEEESDVFHLRPGKFYPSNIIDYVDDADYYYFYYGDDFHYINLNSVSRIKFTPRR